ncbi:PPK2 family polyphosphate kinase [Schaalia turicensis]|uniref:PPK2 family polyphosphate kinase n=1 Tax=Actinomycetaceae TaxID=2049 RepID=UPI00254AEBF8|nr:MULTISPECIES: PPK2 family polyphosphate kinase [unclassified Pauljensenia]MDK6400056.1 polyphosphate kinase 2 family protein [Pauljensenia sp. UMB9872]MDK7172661.1 polyphosphate kinase 2 family protein [Pauljensenia sp. UMB1235]
MGSKENTGQESPEDSMSYVFGPSKYWTGDPRDLLIASDAFDLNSFIRDATPGWGASKKKALKAMEKRAVDFSELQERLYAASKEGASDSVLLILQGLDTAGKGGIVRHVIGQVDPQGVALKAFKAPTEEERAHDFLWRVRPHLPRPGYIGVFDRSHYEDLLVPTSARYANQESVFAADEDELNRRYHDIYEMELEAVRAGMKVIKVCLVVSYEEQGERLMERLERPDKHWKFSTGDLDTRDNWSAYQDAYSEVIRRTSTRIAPWYVIPGDRKWYARLAVQEILVRTLEGINPTWPKADFDVDGAKDRLSASLTPEVLSSHAHEKSGDTGSQDKNEGESKPKKSKKSDKKKSKKSDASASKDAPHISVSAWG